MFCGLWFVVCGLWSWADAGAGPGAGGVGGAPSEGAAGAGAGAGDSSAPGSADPNKLGSSAVVSPEHADHIRKLITSILSKLLNMADVAESVRAVQDTTARMTAGAEDPSAAPLSRVALEVGVAGLKKLFSLCETVVGRQAGHKAWVGAAAYV